MGFNSGFKGLSYETTQKLHDSYLIVNLIYSTFRCRGPSTWKLVRGHLETYVQGLVLRIRMKLSFTTTH